MPMRIVAGEAKGTRLAPVPAGTRPMSDRAREGLFSSLGPRVTDAHVLDLFAGTGSIGLEALSRGAASSVFVDSAPSAAKTIGDNLRRTKFQKRGTIRRQDVLRALGSGLPRSDLIFLDPPYRLPIPELEAILEAIPQVAAPEATLVLSRSTRTSMPVIPVNWALERRLTYGDSVVLVFTVP
jgi:16S rRNA (guanine966-N2)-methyltransferase